MLEIPESKAYAVPAPRSIKKLWFVFLFLNLIAVFISIGNSAQAAPSNPPAKETTTTDSYKKESANPSQVSLKQYGKYFFSRYFFKGRHKRWSRFFSELKGKENLAYLEVGVFEGGSLFWMLDNVLTHPSSRAFALDIFAPSYIDVFENNLKAYGHPEKVKVMKGSSHAQMPTLPQSSFDIIYIDGNHTARSVFMDTADGWRLLKVNGILIFDDYQWERDWPIKDRPEESINLFLTAFGHEIEVIHKAFIVVVRKLPSNLHTCFGQNITPGQGYNYSWRNRKLKRNGKINIPLSESERALVEDILRSRKLGSADVIFTDELRERAGFAELVKKLQLKVPRSPKISRKKSQ